MLTVMQHVRIEPDRKPLEILLKKPVHEAPLRLQRMILNLLPFNLTITYKKGEEMLLADPLSRATTDTPTQAMEDGILIYDIKELTCTSDRRLEKLIEETEKDEIQALTTVIQQGWPDERKHTSPIVRPYWTPYHRTTEYETLYILGVLHESHQEF